jgi:hypothetical protein
MKLEWRERERGRENKRSLREKEGEDAETGEGESHFPLERLNGVKTRSGEWEGPS